MTGLALAPMSAHLSLQRSIPWLTYRSSSTRWLLWCLSFSCRSLHRCRRHHSRLCQLYCDLAALTHSRSALNVAQLVPLANLLGRRPMSLICSAICVGTTIWLALAKTDGSFMAARAINGVGAAANESFMAMVR